MKRQLETYLARLRYELRKQGLLDDRIIEEAQGHLSDATERGLGHGLSQDAAEADAIAHFGTPALVASKFATERFRVRNRILFTIAVGIGLAIAYVDSQPTWDDSGVTAFSMGLAAGILAFIGPQLPWVWAFAVGIWIPLHAIAGTPSLGSVAMFGVLLFPLAGASAGLLVRRTLQTVAGDRQSGFHDRQLAFHTALRTKRGWVDLELATIVSDPYTHLAPYSARVAPGALGPLGQIESVTLIEESDRFRTYRAVFRNTSKAICTVVLEPDGRAISIDWSRSAAS